MSEQKSDLIELDDGTKKWNAQQVGVNSDVPLMDSGTGQKFIIRQFLFSFDPSMLLKIREKKTPVPTAQELFNSNWRQIRMSLWGDGLVAVQENVFPPKIIIGKKKYKIILTCMPKFGIQGTVNDKVNRLQDVLKPKSLTEK